MNDTTTITRGMRRIFFCLCLISYAWNAHGQSCDCPPISSCGECTGGLTSLTLRYTGGAIIGLTITVKDGSNNTLFSSSALTLGTTPFTVVPFGGASLF